MSPDEDKGMKQHRGHAFIPAGIFIGLGIGIIVGHVVSGVLIGLGLGFLASSILSCREEPDAPADAGASCSSLGRRWIPVVLGMFFILFGVAIVWAPSFIWPYLFAALLILIGIGFLLRGFLK